MSGRVIVGAVRNDNVDDFYDVYAYLRDTSVPAQRPLFNFLRDHYDDKLTAAALVSRENDGIFELVIWYGGVEMRFRAGMPRDNSQLDERVFFEHCEVQLG